MMIRTIEELYSEPMERAPLIIMQEKHDHG